MLLRQRYFALLGGHAMTKITSFNIAGALLALGLSAAPAQAGPNRTWVSGMGTDSGACTRAYPCKTFAFALTQTAAGGEIDVLDPAGYGTMTITKAISVVNDGVGTAAIGTSSGNGVTINAGANDSVHLRGLTVEGLGSGSSGILFNTGGNLAIESCVVRNFANRGIFISPSTSSSFSVSNTIVSNTTSNGIVVQPTGSAVVTGVLSKVTANNNSLGGIDVDGRFTTGTSLNVTIVDSVASNNLSVGVDSVSSSGAAATAVMLRNVVASNDVNGLLAQGNNAILRVAHSVITGNAVAVVTFFGGVINSYGDNDIDGNTNNNTSALTMIPTH
jgi:hypothetical protein